MSLISFKDNTGSEIFNNVLNESLHENHERLTNQNISFLNNCEKCIVCGNGMEKNEETQILQPLLKHHVSYFPQVIAYVHCKCHQKIHDPENPITSLIQYEKGDSLKFYNQKKAIGAMA